MNKKLTKLRDAEAEKFYKDSGWVPSEWAVMNFKAGFDCRDKLDNEALKAMTESRNAYAMALKVALENSIFPNKQYVKAEIDKILTPEIRKLRGDKV